jgi:mono/diheme cytochrome c family protein
MRISIWLATSCLALVPLAANAAGDVSVERGLQVSITGGCHDCHTAGYNESEGKVDPNTALKGTAVGWRGPWGTSYPRNLRITASDKTEDQFVEFLRTFKTRPPMPWYNVHAMDESDLRSLYQYIKSLGAPGDQVPEALPPDAEPKTPYIPIVPPTMPKT